MPGPRNYIEEIRAVNTNSAEAIEQAKAEFEACLVAASNGVGQIVKAWAKEIKQDAAQLALVSQFAQEQGLTDTYCDIIRQGQMHRMCFRTFVVNQYIYSLIVAAQQDNAAVANILDELGVGTNPDNNKSTDDDEDIELGQ